MIRDLWAAEGLLHFSKARDDSTKLHLEDDGTAPPSPIEPLVPAGQRFAP